ncbi:DNA repair helicase XPB1-like [Micractinium conductrix]|uniref:DNA 3'-5' helicase n=1 Tax=Micractinium conductrix TaxID=554055 RepID=A0A2P6VGC3_9CHLO|nr:DNA repair helicase XPB1-like [Micractinium conductrix]|eukprot:PSC73140.1 DNA repair helicase XPB1-like [Micractinium conductrix]
MSAPSGAGGTKVRLKVTAGRAAAAPPPAAAPAGQRRSKADDEEDEYRPDADPDVIEISDDEDMAEELGGKQASADMWAAEEEDEEWEISDSEEEGGGAGRGKGKGKAATAGGGGGGAAATARRKPSRGAGSGSAPAKRAAAAKPAGGAAPRKAAPKKAAGGGGASAAARRRRRADLDDEEDLDLDEEFFSDDDEGFRLGGGDEQFQDFSRLQLKPDHHNRPLWVTPDARIFLETFSPVYKQAYDFLIAIAEPVSRPEFIHEYQLTPHSLYAAVSIGLECGAILGVLARLSKNVLPPQILEFVRECTQNYGKVKLVLQQNRFFVESPHPEILRKLLADPVVKDAARLDKPGGADGAGGSQFQVGAARRDRALADLAAIEEIDLAAEEDEEEGGGLGGAGGAAPGAGAQPPQQQAAQAQRQQPSYMLDAVEEDPDKELHMFEVDPAKVEKVKERCLPDALNYPMLEEYDFKADSHNPDLGIDLKPNVQHRPYQEKSLSKMFGNGRARSGIIVLPCGAGKSLVGVSAAARIKKSCLVLCTNGVSVDQWKYQFEMWTNIQKNQVCRFTSQSREWFESPAGVCITTYTMVAFSGRRSTEGERIMQQIMSREWGLILLDEVHVVPAAMFRRVLGIVKAHAKLGLTATLVREDSLIGDLNFLIGPKLYEANWLDLTRGGHIANVQCAEVWCPLSKEFAREYLRASATPTQKQLLYVMNPAKLRACHFLVDYHERRGDKVIVFSDNIYALREYAMRMRKPFIYGATGHQERTRILHAFKHNPQVNTVFLSKVGDNSLDIPEANVLVQISSHAGSRRQEAQRLGRILRKKKARPGVAAGGEEYDAFFYSLVTLDTQEVYFTAKRQQFLIDQGYSYKVIPSLLEAAGAEGGQLLLSTKEEQLDVLAAILAASDADLAEEDVGVDKDDVANLKKKAPARRVVGSMAALSGAAGISYLEYSTKQGGRSRPAGGGKLAKMAKKFG